MYKAQVIWLDINQACDQLAIKKENLTTPKPHLQAMPQELIKKYIFKHIYIIL